eukprot:CAMPEP_0198138126 /NCGR_PEP_ID=MMETSP1443-20131203/1545_1 /TAXON_ID=186043 /ORGANISM="Entomoneis sp., Strain CCMP2396" /LENGTH=90 /DNA_ID=CAMNT_0043799769 /DNA_START=125 /DNA_END=393 /DNA_ORIENTATION=+
MTTPTLTVVLHGKGTKVTLEAPTDSLLCDVRELLDQNLGGFSKGYLFLRSGGGFDKGIQVTHVQEGFKKASQCLMNGTLVMRDRRAITVT